MIYKGIEVKDVNVVVYLKEKDQGNHQLNQKAVGKWCAENGIEAATECPIDDLVYIYLKRDGLFNLKQLQNVYSKAKDYFAEVVVALQLSKFNEDGYNFIELSWQEFENICVDNGAKI